MSNLTTMIISEIEAVKAEIATLEADAKTDEEEVRVAKAHLKSLYEALRDC